jgi:hypothetical protein
MPESESEANRGRSYERGWPVSPVPVELLVGHPDADSIAALDSSAYPPAQRCLPRFASLSITDTHVLPWEEFRDRPVGKLCDRQPLILGEFLNR